MIQCFDGWHVIISFPLNLYSRIWVVLVILCISFQDTYKYQPYLLNLKGEEEGRLVSTHKILDLQYYLILPLYFTIKCRSLSNLSKVIQVSDLTNGIHLPRLITQDSFKYIYYDIINRAFRHTLNKCIISIWSLSNWTSSRIPNKFQKLRKAKSTQ